MVSTLDQMQVQNGTGPGVRRIKCMYIKYVHKKDSCSSISDDLSCSCYGILDLRA